MITRAFRRFAHWLHLDAPSGGVESGPEVRADEIGTVVAKGDVVAMIEDTVIKLQKQELLAEVERARARLKYLESEEGRYVKLAESNLAAATKLEESYG